MRDSAVEVRLDSDLQEGCVIGIGISVHTRVKVDEYTRVHELKKSVRSWSIWFTHPYSSWERAGE